MDIAGGVCGVEARMAAPLALYLMRHAIGAYQAEAAKGTPPGPALERLKAAAAILDPEPERRPANG
jgi:hypothetical protein